MRVIDLIDLFELHSMKLRIRINRQISRVELQGVEPTLAELQLQIQEILLPSHGLSPETEFTLSLNGTEPLVDTGQTLSSCGIVSGDLISVILPQSVSPAPPFPSGQSVSSSSCSSTMSHHSRTNQRAATLSSSEPRRSQATRMQEDGTLEGETLPVVPTWEPMLCSEAEGGKVPPFLEILHNGAQSRSPSDSLMVAVHLLMMETGFVPHGSDIKPGEMPTGWRREGGAYRLHYSHPPLCENSIAMVVAVSMGTMLVINATLKIETVDTVCKLSLRPSSFVTAEWAGPSAATVFNDLGKLSRIFKDQLVFPLIAAARDAMSLPTVFGLCALPPEVLLRVLSLLDVHSLVALSSVSRRFDSITADNRLWRHLCHRDFKHQDASRTSKDKDWKNLYKTLYNKQKYAERRSQQHNVFRLPRPPHSGHSNTPMPFCPPFHPDRPGRHYYIERLPGQEDFEEMFSLNGEDKEQIPPLPDQEDPPEE